MKLRLLIAFILLVFIVPSKAQNITGIWRGYFNSINGRYKYEVQINQLANKSLQGVTYSYKNHRILWQGRFAGNLYG